MIDRQERLPRIADAGKESVRPMRCEEVTMEHIGSVGCVLGSVGSSRRQAEPAFSTSQRHRKQSRFLPLGYLRLWVGDGCGWGQGRDNGHHNRLRRTVKEGVTRGSGRRKPLCTKGFYWCPGWDLNPHTLSGNGF